MKAELRGRVIISCSQLVKIFAEGPVVVLAVENKSKVAINSHERAYPKGQGRRSCPCPPMQGRKSYEWCWCWWNEWWQHQHPWCLMLSEYEILFGALSALIVRGVEPGITRTCSRVYKGHIFVLVSLRVYSGPQQTHSFSSELTTKRKFQQMPLPVSPPNAPTDTANTGVSQYRARALYACG